MCGPPLTPGWPLALVLSGPGAPVAHLPSARTRASVPPFLLARARGKGEVPWGCELSTHRDVSSLTHPDWKWASQATANGRAFH